MLIIPYANCPLVIWNSHPKQIHSAWEEEDDVEAEMQRMLSQGNAAKSGGGPRCEQHWIKMSAGIGDSTAPATAGSTSRRGSTPHTSVNHRVCRSSPSVQAALQSGHRKGACLEMHLKHALCKQACQQKCGAVSPSSKPRKHIGHTRFKVILAPTEGSSQHCYGRAFVYGTTRCT